MNPTARKLLLVSWVDSSSHPDGWKPLDELGDDLEPVYCQSVGWLAGEGEDGIVLVPHISGGPDRGVREYGKGEITIPKRAIVETVVLPATGQTA